MMAISLSSVIQTSVALVFLGSGWAKLRNSRQFTYGLRDYRLLPDSMVHQAGYALIFIELTIGLSHLSGWLLSVTVPGSIALLAVFAAIVTVVLHRKLSIQCLCFGAGKDQELVTRRTLLRPGLLLCAELVVWQSIHAPEYSQEAFDPNAFVVTVLYAALLLIFTSWLLSLPEILSAIKGCAVLRARFQKSDPASMSGEKS